MLFSVLLLPLMVSAAGMKRAVKAKCNASKVAANNFHHHSFTLSPHSTATIASPTAVLPVATTPQNTVPTPTTASPTSTILTSSTTSTSPPASSQPTAAAPGTKKGIVYSLTANVAPFAKYITWTYNWGMSPGGTLPAGIEYVPMLWGSSASGWSEAVTTALASGSKYLMAFNEPDGTGGGQSNISPSTAASLWKTNMEPYAGKAGLVSPAVTNGGAPEGITWLTDFMAACDGCTVDAFALHWYSTTNSGQNGCYFYQYFTQAQQTLSALGYNQPFWITEFAPDNQSGASSSQSEGSASSWYPEVVAWMEASPFIQRYSAFGAFTTISGNFTPALLEADLTFSESGNAYATSGSNSATVSSIEKLCSVGA